MSEQQTTADGWKQTSVEGSSWTMTRLFNAPRDLVFEMWSSCEHLTRWWGPHSWPMAECRLDFRVGGAWHYCLRGPNPGDEGWGLNIYGEITPLERIRYTECGSDAQGNPAESIPRVEVTAEFADLEGRTVLTLTAEFPTSEELERMIGFGLESWFGETFDRLDEHLERAG